MPLVTPTAIDGWSTNQATNHARSAAIAAARLLRGNAFQAYFAKIWEPHQKLLTKILTSCSRAGLVRKDMTPVQLTTLLNSTLIALAQIGVFHLGVKGAELTEDQLWAWCKQALTPPTGIVKPRSVAKAPAKRTSARKPRKLTG